MVTGQPGLKLYPPSKLALPRPNIRNFPASCKTQKCCYIGTYPKSDIDIEDTCMQSDIANPNRYDVNVLLSTLV